jgi:N-dimethylarginine dimethylaminohydrolase
VHPSISSSARGFATRSVGGLVPAGYGFATALAGKLAAQGYLPVGVELGELKKGGGSVRCCVAELRGPV